jgi:hypothetical protein
MQVHRARELIRIRITQGPSSDTTYSAHSASQ